MTVRKQFAKQFSEENLKHIFTEYVIHSGATGIDNLDQYAFRVQLDEQVAILSRKMLAGTYQFTKYKLKLISKGRNKTPREISIPTVRDRIALRAMCDFLTQLYKRSVKFDLPQKIIKQVKSDVISDSYDGCIKLDVTNFYPSIKQKELERRLGKKIRGNREIIDVILSAIKSPTVSVSRSSDEPAKCGVPQGLAISNILAAIYLVNIDKYLLAYPNIKYYRYVDDVLIFCDFDDAKDITRDVMKRFLKIGLKIHDPKKFPEKSSVELLSRGFDYLGYKFIGSMVTARQGTIEKLKASLVAIFTSYKHSAQRSQEFLLWRLNLRITGCVYENKSKGWLFFFSEINDDKLLHRLDHYVKKLCKRFGVTVTPKKFVRAFKELSFKRYETKYIPNFDLYSLEQKKDVLDNYFKMDISRMNELEVDFEFHKK